MARTLRITVLALALFAINVAYIPAVFAEVTTVNPGGEVTTDNTSGGGGLTNPLGSIDSLPKFMEAILGAIVTLGTIVLTLAIIYVGFLFVKAQGNAEQISAARSALLWTVIGGLILLGAETVGLVIGNTVESL
jgi:hypothetical protein